MRVPIKKTMRSGGQRIHWVKPRWGRFDALTRQLFVAPPVVHHGYKTGEAETKHAIRAIFGQEPDSSTWGRLVAGVAGSTLYLDGYEDDDTGDFGVFADVRASPITSHAERLVLLSGMGGACFMRNVGIARAVGAPAGSVRRVVAVQIMTARALGLQRISLEAGGPPRYSGYAVWPLLGFDGLLQQDLHREVIREFERLHGRVPRTVREVAQTNYDLWRDKGRGFRGEFALSTYNTQWEDLLRYLEMEGIYRP